MIKRKEDYKGLKRSGKLKSKGKVGLQWDRERRKQKKVSAALEQTACELRLPGCTGRGVLDYAHSMKRRFTRKEGLDEVVLACRHCHNAIEGHPRMREIVLGARAHRGGDFFHCACLKLVTPADMKVHRELYTGVCCDECFLKQESEAA